MSTNISKEKREKLMGEIEQIKNYIEAAPQDENTEQLLGFINDIKRDLSGKKYGLVFEKHRESIDEILENNAPVLTEDEALFIDNGGQMNFLIEGDNLASLNLLKKTHREKIDLIYIDPPYNTGNKDFVYDDVFVDGNDAFRHSKWLSFMEKRLITAKELLSENGIIYISINDKESHALKLLLDDVFGGDNYISDISVEMSPSSGVKRSHKNKGYIKNKENIFVYSKNNVEIVELYDEWTEFDNHYSIWFDGQKYTSLLNVIKEKFKNYRGINSKMYLFYDDVYSFIVANSEKIYRSHDASKWSLENVKNGETLFDDDSVKIIKSYNAANDQEFELLKSKKNGGYDRLEPLSWNVKDGKIQTLRGDLWLNFDKDMGNVSKEGGVKFPNGKKPVRLLCDIIKSGSVKKDCLVLDFFAGSGTTGHAVMKLNAEDGGNRKFILCTNNENNICRDVTYERIKRVIEKENYNASLKYFKVEYVPISDRLYYEYADELLEHVKELVELENGINFSGNGEIAIILTDEELDDFMESLPEDCKAVYIGHDVLPSEAQERLFAERKIDVNIIPDYYYRELDW